MNAQQIFKSTFNALINDGYSISVDTVRYQSLSEHALSKEDFSRGTDIYMLSGNLNLKIGNSAGYNDEILISNIGLSSNLNLKIGKTAGYNN